MKRHDLVEISAKGREKIIKTIEEDYSANPFLQGFELDSIKVLVAMGYNGVLIPGIVRREEKEQLAGRLAIGFASPYLLDGRRLRIPAIIDIEHIERTVSPYEVLERGWVPRNNCLKALKEIKKESQARGLRLGIWGSAGLEVYTGLRYTHEMSDLDLLVEQGNYDEIVELGDVLKGISVTHGCTIDMEVSLQNGYGIKLNELLMDTESIMGKGLKDVVLIPRQEVLKSLGK